MRCSEQLYLGGEIYTVNDSLPSAEALAVRDGIIIGVGSEPDCRAALGNAPKIVNLNGSVLMPGFIDTHLHPTLMVFYELNCDLSTVTSLEEMLATLKKKADQANSTDWLLGLQFDEQLFTSPTLPTRHDLDAVCLDRPILILRKDGHSAIANTPAIAVAGITNSTGDPAGGRIERDPAGNPSGVFRETAVSLLLKAMPIPGIQAIMDAGVSTFQNIARNGITSIGAILQTDEEGVAGSQGAYDIPLMELIIDTLPINLYSLLVSDRSATIESHRQSVLHRPQGNPGRRIGGMKFWADGTFSSRTAFMTRPFSDDPDNKGFLIHPEEKMYQRMVSAHTAGEQIAIHSIGDASTWTCVRLFERLFNEYPVANHRHRLEHASQLDPELIEEIARLNLVISTQPVFIKSEKAWLKKRLGEERTRWTYPFCSLLDAGIVVAGASDAPIEDVSVLQAIQCCVTREGFEPQQGITAREAVKMFTINAAYAQSEEREKGSLCIGKRADMVILDQNPVTVPAEKIGSIRVEQTICGGKPLLD